MSWPIALQGGSSKLAYCLPPLATVKFLLDSVTEDEQVFARHEEGEPEYLSNTPRAALTIGAETSKWVRSRHAEERPGYGLCQSSEGIAWGRV
jgi:hypothetical protein